MIFFSLTSLAFKQEGLIPQEYTCQGKDISPELHWKGAPPSTKSFALTMIDPDAPGGDFVHWILYNIAPTQTMLPKAFPKTEKMQGINDFGNAGYGGPCPPRQEKHAYIFTLYAVDIFLNQSKPLSRLELEQALTGHILAKASLTGYYQKNKTI